MAEQNVVKHYMRLNLQNEQHQRIQKVLDGLDRDIHKSENQFIIKAVDFYIQSFDEADIMGKQQRRKTAEYVTKDDLAGIRKEIEDSVKNELVRLLGAAITGGVSAGIQDNGKGTVCGDECNPYAARAAEKWG